MEPYKEHKKRTITPAQMLTIDRLNERSRKLMGSSLGKALNLAEETQSLSIDIQYKKGIAESLLLQGMVLYELKSRKKAMRCLQDSLQFCGDLRDRTVELEVRQQLVECYTQLGDIKMVKHHLEAYFKLNEGIKADKNVHLLGEIGKAIVSSRTPSEIIEEVYGSVNKLMDANSFAIGILSEDKTILKFINSKEEGQSLPEVQTKVDEDTFYGSCILDQKEIVINDLDNEYHLFISELPNPLAGRRTNSLVYIPISSKRKQIGVLTVQSYRINAYEPYHLYVLKNLATYIAIALEHNSMFDNLEDEVRSRTKELSAQKDSAEKLYSDVQTMTSIGRSIASSKGIEEINEKVYERLNRIMAAAGFGIGIFDEAANKLRFPGYIEKGKVYDESVYDLNDTNRFAPICFEKNIEFVINDYEKEHGLYIPEDQEPVVGEHVSSLIYMPVRLGNKKLGVITVQSFSKDMYTEREVSFLRNLCNYVAIALENMRAVAEVKTQSKAYQELKVKDHINQRLSARLGVVNGIIKTILKTNTTEGLIYESIKAIKSRMAIDRVSIAIFDMDEYSYMPFTILKEDENTLQYGKSFPLKEFGNIHKLLRQEYKLVENLQDEADLSVSQKRVQDLGVESYLMYPLIVKDQVVGSLNLGNFGPMPYGELELIEIVREAAGGIATALLQNQLQAQIHDSMEVLKSKNMSILESLNYAKRIQEAVLPSQSYIDTVFENFIYYKPKDIVSGDFYWMHEVGEKVIWAVGDCTGHGVPGAFMSMIGNSLLNELVIERGLREPNLILDEMKTAIIKSLGHDESLESPKDGMDIGICCYDRETNVLTYSGAYHSLIFVRDKRIEEYKGDRMPVGLLHEVNDDFTPYKIHLEKGDMLYMFSDGFADQFGGDKSRKFRSSSLVKLIYRVSKLSMDEQKYEVDRVFQEWKGSLPQIDDVCVFGVKI